MSWKKNVFSYLLWVLYAVTAEVGLVCLVDAVCDSAGVEIYIGTIASALYIIAAGLGVYLVHRLVSKYSGKDRKNRSLRIVAEAVAMILLLVTGLVLRIRGLGDAVEGNAYYELAAMISEEDIPWFAHGAIGLYIQMLHGLFYFLGNKLAVAVWAQILLQLGAMLLLYFAVRQSAGSAAAIVMLGFGMFSSYLIEEASSLSPTMLYLFFWAAALLLTVTAARLKKSLWGFPVVGLVISFAAYLDVAGCLLLLISAAVIFCEEEEGSKKGRRRKCLILCLAGAGAGFVGCALMDSLMHGRAFAEVLAGWFQLYRPQGFKLPVSVNVPGTTAKGMAEYILLFCVLTLGMFSFWRNRRSDYRKAWIILLVVLLPAGCFGIFTEEMPMGLYLYLLLAIMAGIAVEECIRVEKPAPEAALLMAAGIGSPMELSPEPACGETAPQSEKGAGGAGQTDNEGASQPGKVKLIENPLPLPKKHVKKKLDYGMEVPAGKDDFDLEVDEKDDFDI